MMGELPSLPAGWVWCELGALLASIKAGKSFSCNPRMPHDHEIGVVKVSAVTWGTYQEDESKTVEDKARHDPSLMVQRGDFLFSRANTIALVGACVIAEKVTKPIMLSDKILRFRFKAPVDRWVLYGLRTMHGRSEIERLATGNQDSMRNIGQGRIRSIRFPLAPLPEQRRIVAAIEQHFSRLDAAVVTLERVKVKLGHTRASVLKAAVEGSLVPSEAALARQRAGDYEPAAMLLERILVERRRKHDEAQVGAKRKKKYKEPVEPDVDGLPGLPEGWTWATADSLSEAQRSITYGVVKLGPETPGGVRTLRSSNVRNLRLEVAYVKPIQPGIAANYKRTSLVGGEVLVTVRGTLGGVVVVPASCKGFNISREVAMLALVAPVVGPCCARFIASPPLQRWMMRRTKGITYRGVNIETLKRLPVPLPPLAEQHRIVAEVDRQLSVLDEVGRLVDTNLARCARLRQAILKRAFEGRLVPQDPEDEPASVLLERINGKEP